MHLDFDQSLSELPLVFLDLETTGLRPTQGHRICEIAMIRMCGDQIEATFEQLINPERELDTGAFLVNHISAEMLDGQPTFATMADPIQAMLHNGIIVAHNAPFDCAFLAHEYDRLGYPAPVNPAIDTLALARRLIHRRYYSLNSFATDLHLEAPMHRAMDDLRVLRVLFGWLATLMSARGIHTLAEVLRCQRGFMPGEPEPAPPYHHSGIRASPMPPHCLSLPPCRRTNRTYRSSSLYHETQPDALSQCLLLFAPRYSLICARTNPPHGTCLIPICGTMES